MNEMKNERMKIEGNEKMKMMIPSSEFSDSR